jgi:hypothetical protein
MKEVTVCHFAVRVSLLKGGNMYIGNRVVFSVQIRFRINQPTLKMLKSSVPDPDPYDLEVFGLPDQM